MTDRFPSLITCGQLQDAGFPQDTLFSWKIAEGGIIDVISLHLTDAVFTGQLAGQLAAPLTDEILEQLPNKTVPVSITRVMDEYSAHYDTSDSLGQIDAGWHSNPAEAAAQLFLKVREGSDVPLV